MKISVFETCKGDVLNIPADYTARDVLKYLANVLNDNDIEEIINDIIKSKHTSCEDAEDPCDTCGTWNNDYELDTDVYQKEGACNEE